MIWRPIRCRSRQPPIPAGVAPAGDGGSFGLWSLSSISRDRLANRARVTPLADSGGMLADAADGRLTRASVRSAAGGMSSILRNRLQAEGDVQYNYPDIHADPAKIYHDRFGIDEVHDRFLFPWLMDFIFEDRWLLSENDPAVAFQDQFRRRIRVDIRDPDPDLANFPNGAYTLPKGRLYIESSPVGFFGASKYYPRVYQWEYRLRYMLTDNLEFGIFSNGLTAQARQSAGGAATGEQTDLFRASPRSAPARAARASIEPYRLRSATIAATAIGLPIGAPAAVRELETRAGPFAATQ